MLPVVFGLAGPDLLADEATFFRDADPLGFILFKRNCLDKAQVLRLTAALRDAVGRTDAPIMIDQEGGRVARLKPPHWSAYPPAKVFGDLAKIDLTRAKEAVCLNATLIGADLHEIGITMDCAPLVDVPIEGAHEMIGDRAFGTDPEIVMQLGREACDGFLRSNVLPIVKHLPGYGRACVDSHKSLPVIDASLEAMDDSDLYPFRHLADLPWGMSAHALYTAIDETHAATVSSKIIREIIRDRIGFDGILITDDICMEALRGTAAERALACLNAGCDVVLHCNGAIDDMRAVAAQLPQMSTALATKIAAAEKLRTQCRPAEHDLVASRSRLEQLLAYA